MAEAFQPELGQIAFGQPFKRFGVPDAFSNALSVLGDAIKAATGQNPADNSGARFNCPTFQMHAYSWSDDEQPFNFKWGEVEVSWYKYLGRGESANRALTAEDASAMLLACLPAIATGSLE
jgi:hypothetical protein